MATATTGVSDTISAQKKLVDRLNDAGWDLIVGDAFVRGTRDIGYKSTSFAMAELIDNSIQAGATWIDVVFGFNQGSLKPAKIAVIDNGWGMIAPMVRASLVWGAGTRYSDRQGFGKYGYGLPSASVSQCLRVEVYSKVDGEPWAKSYLDVEEISQGKWTEMHRINTPKEILQDPPAFVIDHLKGQKRWPLTSGTVVVWDKLAKLVWAISHHEPLAATVGPDTLVIIDEAGMADTLTLDHVVTWCLDQGASIRLIGDDQQLGAIGAGGVLRDIATQHGALHLDHVVRFTDPAEAAASLALRSGDIRALGYYLDHQRVHVVSPDTATHLLLAAWQADRAAGLDALMLAPTRDQVAALNAAARAARLDGHRPGRQIDLSDGNKASTGDTVITRRNNRDLASSDTAWVRNGDRWQVTAVHRDHSIDVRHLRNHNRLTLPADYVAEFVELGYATTIHAAQGVTADTCHGLLTGEESRQQAYTMLTRGRQANHAWLQVDTTDTHITPVDPGLLQPAGAVQLLETVIGHDEAPASATTLLREADEARLLLGPAARCYLDAITYAAEHHLTDQVKQAIDIAGTKHGLDRADAWPTLRSHLMLIAANGHNPTEILRQAVAVGPLDQARDRAAVIDYRLDLTQANDRTRGPLPWLPGIPTQLLDDPTWKEYLSGRYKLTRQLADETRQHAADDTPRWAEYLPGLDPELIADIQQWRAAHQTPDTDLRPTGTPEHSPAERDTQRHLDHALETSQADIRDWVARITTAAPATTGDPTLPTLAAHLARLARTRPDIAEHLAAAAELGPLPVEHTADALRYRITTQIRKEDDMHRQEALHIANTRRHLPPPPTSHGPDHGHHRGISI